MRTPEEKWRDDGPCAPQCLAECDGACAAVMDTSDFTKPTMQERREAAMVYALWDSANGVRLEKPEQYEEYLPRAREVLRWLEHRGWHLHPDETREDHWLVADLKRRLRVMAWAVLLLALVTGMAVTTMLLSLVQVLR